MTNAAAIPMSIVITNALVSRLAVSSDTAQAKGTIMAADTTKRIREMILKTSRLCMESQQADSGICHPVIIVISFR